MLWDTHRYKEPTPTFQQRLVSFCLYAPTVAFCLGVILFTLWVMYRQSRF